MAHFPYLIVGGGMTAAAALSGIREIDKQNQIVLFSSEPHRPYNRPPLSKALWKGKPLDAIWRKTDDLGVEFHLGRKIEQIDPPARRVTDDKGQVYTYDKLLLATGGTPRRLPFGGENILYYRTLDDYQRLRGEIQSDGASRIRKFVVIGGGFIGSEIAAALRMNEQEVTMIFPEKGIGGRVYPPDLSQFLNQYYRSKGIDVLSGESVTSFQEQGIKYLLRTGDGRSVQTDHVIAGIGIRPDIELAQAAGLETGDGIIVDEFLRTSQADIFAAGDVASFYNPALNKRIRAEHEDNANSMGIHVGKNMAYALTAQQLAPYHHLPFFYSDLFDLGYEAVGEMSADLEIISDWKDPYHKGVIYYLKDGRVRGVLLWNVWGQVEAARKLIAETGPFTPQNVKGRLPA
jgi:3-phenylpropionate/trans-cinnamate dioxygenase ferredoxin reductase component